jgi:hypothetical protein
MASSALTNFRCGRRTLASRTPLPAGLPNSAAYRAIQ